MDGGRWTVDGRVLPFGGLRESVVEKPHKGKMNMPSKGSETSPEGRTYSRTYFDEIPLMREFGTCSGRRSQDSNWSPASSWNHGEKFLYVQRVGERGFAVNEFC